MTFYQRFIELCNQHGVKPTPLLISLQISAGNLANWKKGILPNADTQRKLTEYFNVSTDYLLGRTDDHTIPQIILHNILEIITDTIDSTNKSENALEKEIGLSQGQIKHWRNGRNNVSIESLIKLYNYYNVPTDYLLELTDCRIPYPKKTEEATQKIIPIKENKEPPITPDNEYPIGRIIRMRVIGVIAAGYDGEAQEEYIGDISFLEESLHGYDPEDCFVLRVSGDSMYPELKDGDLVLIHRQPSVDSGDIAAVMYDGNDATLKRVHYVNGKGWIELIPENTEYPIKRIENSDLEECRILGKLIDLVSRRY